MIENLTIDDFSKMMAIILNCKNVLKLDAELAWTHEQLYGAIESGKTLGYVKDRQILGFVIYKELGNDGTGPLDIWCLAVDPKSLRKGVMTHLFHQLKLLNRDLWLEVHQQNIGAINFYKSQKFQQVGTRLRYYEDGASALLMSWKSKQSQEN